MPALKDDLTIPKASLIAGFGYILMFCAPIAEFRVFDKLVDLGHGEITLTKIAATWGFSGMAFFCISLIFLGDIMAAWAIY